MAIFSLNEVRTEQIKNIANDNFESWPESATYGYFAGNGQDDRLDFSNDTASSPGNTPTQERSGLAAVSTSSYGYFGGGSAPSIPGRVCTIDRLDFSNETTSAPGKNLPVARRELAVTSSNSYGYFGGGEIVNPSPPPSGLRVVTVDRIDLSNETTDNPVALSNLSQARSHLAAVSTSSYGYFAGGLIDNPSPPPDSLSADRVDRLDFSNETLSLPGNNLPQARWGVVALSSSSYGYFGGGVVPSIVCTIDRLDFSNETFSTPFGAGNGLSQSRFSVAGTSSNSYGYFAGGQAPPPRSTIDRLDFSNDTISDIGDLSLARSSFAAVSGGASYRISGSRTYGYFGGGYGTPPTPSLYKSTIDRIDFSSDTFTVPGNHLTQTRGSLAAVSSSSYGYFGGGYYPAVTRNTVDRLDLSNETTDNPAALPNLPQSRSSLAAVSSSSYGYFGGGSSPPLTPNILDTIDRLDFSNETTSAPGNNLPQARSSLTATQSNSYGYFAGGSTPSYVCTIDRLDFSNETFTTPFGAGNGLSAVRRNLAATESSSYGYFGGGQIPSPSTPGLTTVNRIDFSNEVASLPGNNLPDARRGLAGTSSNSYGYFASGFSPPYVATVDRLDFSNETASLLGDSLSQGRIDFTALSN